MPIPWFVAIQINVDPASYTSQETLLSPLRLTQSLTQLSMKIGYGADVQVVQPKELAKEIEVDCVKLLSAKTHFSNHIRKRPRRRKPHQFPLVTAVL